MDREEDRPLSSEEMIRRAKEELAAEPETIAEEDFDIELDFAPVEPTREPVPQRPPPEQVRRVPARRPVRPRPGPRGVQTPMVPVIAALVAIAIIGIAVAIFIGAANTAP